ncbi:MAG: hypothetical protein ACR2QO_13650 [Acidimicrobiales bacterium]
MATTTTTATTARPARTGRALVALLGGVIAVTAAYHATQSLLGQDPVTAIPAASTPATADPFQVMADLTPVVSAHLHRGAVAADPFQVMADLTPVVSAQTADRADD